MEKAFLERMKLLLKDDYQKYLDTFDENKSVAIRVNTHKISVEDFVKICSFKISKIPYTKDGFYVQENVSLGNHPYHHAGLFYVQDPGAMYTFNTIKVNPDWLVLDLCASPGGKTTQIANALTNGYLISNEIDYKRSKVLFSNVERLGLDNTIILNENSDNLSKKYPNTFDCIFIDAPCSGEGMFRKNAFAITDWSINKVMECASIQKKLLADADRMLKDGGYIVYSTCTYSLEENELLITNFLNNYDYEVIEIDQNIAKYTKDGYVNDEINAGLVKARRFYPHISNGEGQFCVVLKKKGILDTNHHFLNVKNMELDYIKDDIDLTLNIEKYNDKFYNKIPIDTNNLNVISGGVQIGELINNHFNYHHYFIKAYGNYFKNKLNLDLNDPRVSMYLHGEEIIDETVNNGYGVILVNNYPLGLFKCSNHHLKNHYPKGLRTLQRY